MGQCILLRDTPFKVVVTQRTAKWLRTGEYQCNKSQVHPPFIVRTSSPNITGTYLSAPTQNEEALDRLVLVRAPRAETCQFLWPLWWSQWLENQIGEKTIPVSGMLLDRSSTLVGDLEKKICRLALKLLSKWNIGCLKWSCNSRKCNGHAIPSLFQTSDSANWPLYSSPTCF